MYSYISMSTKACTPKPICYPKGTNAKVTNTITKPHNIKTKVTFKVWYNVCIMCSWNWHNPD